MYSFDDYYYFYLVVKYGGFSAAAEISGITKSKLSRRILDMEKKFDVALIQRSTRHFRVTPLGQEFFEECRKIIEQTDCARNILTRQKSEPQGMVKISCPAVMMSLQVRSILNSFLRQYAKVNVELELTSRQVDLIHDDVDLAIRTVFEPREELNLIVKDLVKTRHCLVISPALLGGKTISTFEQLNQYPHVALGTRKQSHHWNLCHSVHKDTMQIPIEPRLKCNDLAGIYFAALDGVGIADLPFLTVEDDIRHGRLVHVLPEWHSNIGAIQLVYTQRKSQRLVMSKLIDALVDGFADIAKNNQGYL